MNGEERLQDWLPEERATYYIIKDYRRMYGECFYAKKMMRKAAREVEKVTKRNKELEAKYYKIQIGKQTALDVCKKYKEQIATLQALELEQLYEEQRITSTERITAIASLMQRVREEIDSRDLSQVPTEKLIDLYLKQSSALREEIIEPNFQSTEEQSRDRKEREYLDRLTATP